MVVSLSALATIKFYFNLLSRIVAHKVVFFAKDVEETFLSVLCSPRSLVVWSSIQCFVASSFLVYNGICHKIFHSLINIPSPTFQNWSIYVWVNNLCKVEFNQVWSKRPGRVEGELCVMTNDLRPSFLVKFPFFKNGMSWRFHNFHLQSNVKSETWVRSSTSSCDPKVIAKWLPAKWGIPHSYQSFVQVQILSCDSPYLVAKLKLSYVVHSDRNPMVIVSWHPRDVK